MKKWNEVERVVVTTFADGDGAITFYRMMGSHSYVIKQNNEHRQNLALKALDAKPPTKVTATSDFRAKADVLRGELGF